ncbi:hypothetical protein L538_1338 [Bordetella hinzii 4161]|nr:hypothetical protein L538_1338 [Bordetella hinzii 4161]
MLAVPGGQGRVRQRHGEGECHRKGIDNVAFRAPTQGVATAAMLCGRRQRKVQDSGVADTARLRTPGSHLHWQDATSLGLSA